MSETLRRTRRGVTPCAPYYLAAEQRLYQPQRAPLCAFWTPLWGASYVQQQDPHPVGLFVGKRHNR